MGSWGKDPQGGISGLVRKEREKHLSLHCMLQGEAMGGRKRRCPSASWESGSCEEMSQWTPWSRTSSIQSREECFCHFSPPSVVFVTAAWADWYEKWCPAWLNTVPKGTRCGMLKPRQEPRSLTPSQGQFPRHHVASSKLITCHSCMTPDISSSLIPRAFLEQTQWHWVGVRRPGFPSPSAHTSRETRQPTTLGLSFLMRIIKICED